MNQYNVVEANKYCRLCLSDDGQMEQIFGDENLSFVDRIYECTTLKLVEVQGMPTLICCQCRLKLDLWRSFREQCLSTDEILQKAHSDEIVVSIEIKDENVGEIQILYEETSEDDRQVIEHDSNQKDAFESHINAHDEEEIPETTEEQHDQKKRISRRKYTKQRSYKDEKPEKVHQKKQCPICLKWVAKINQHLSVHNDQKNFQCERCSRRFNQLSNLTKHIRIHTGERPHSCEICHKGFTSTSELAIHRRIHTGEKPYFCHVCAKSFVTSGHLTRHTRIHLGTKPYKCDICSTSFTNSGHLTRHRRIHTGEKPYSCPMCEESFTRSEYLKAHRCMGLI